MRPDVQNSYRMKYPLGGMLFLIAVTMSAKSSPLLNSGSTMLIVALACVILFVVPKWVESRDCH